MLHRSPTTLTPRRASPCGAPARPRLHRAVRVVCATSAPVVPRPQAPQQDSAQAESAVSTSYSPTTEDSARSPAFVPAFVKEIEQEMLLPLPREVEGLVDDPNVHNPLQRHERLGTGWFGVLVEHDGVLFQDSTAAHTEAWLQVAKELGYQRPLGHLFRRVKGLRDDVVVTAVFNWTQNPSVARTIADLKVQKYAELTADRNPQPVMLEAGPFLRTLKTYNIPVGLACGSLSASVVRERMKHAKLDTLIDTVVTGDDGGATEVEWYFMDAAAQIGRPPMRCILIGNSSNSIEVARELGMKCVVLAGNTPVYNFASADLVVRDMSQLTFSNLKKLFGQEGLVEPRLGDGGSSGESAEPSSSGMDRDGSAWGSSMQSNMDAWDDEHEDGQFDDSDGGGVGSSSGYGTGMAFSHR